MTIHAPLIDLTKAEIIRQGSALGVDYGLTISCVTRPTTPAPCLACDPAARAMEATAAGVADPTPYANPKRNDCRPIPRVDRLSADHFCVIRGSCFSGR